MRLVHRYVYSSGVRRKSRHINEDRRTGRYNTNLFIQFVAVVFFGWFSFVLFFRCFFVFCFFVFFVCPFYFSFDAFISSFHYHQLQKILNVTYISRD